MTLSLLWQILYWIWFASEVFIGIATRTKRSSGNVRDRGSLLILWVVITSAMTASIWHAEVSPKNMFGGAYWPKNIALAVLAAALAIRWTAVLTLGKSFSSNVAIQESQKVKKDGLYRFIRHPSYLGLLLVFLAVGLHSRNWLSLALALVPTTAALLYRMHIEEAALRSAFGDDYLAYARHTKRLLPGLY